MKPGIDPHIAELADAIERRDLEKYTKVFERLVENARTAKLVTRRDLLLSHLRERAPHLSDHLATSADDADWDRRAGEWIPAWHSATTKAWVERLCDPHLERQLLFQLDNVRVRIRKRLEELASEKAWTHCFEKMTEHERQHLVAWSKAVRSIGRGTGKYAAQHRRNAREHMNECRSAIPAWIMPIYRVAESIKPGTRSFRCRNRRRG